GRPGERPPWGRPRRRPRVSVARAAPGGARGARAGRVDGALRDRLPGGTSFPEAGGRAADPRGHLAPARRAGARGRGLAVAGSPGRRPPSNTPRRGARPWPRAGPAGPAGRVRPGGTTPTPA